MEEAYRHPMGVHSTEPTGVGGKPPARVEMVRVLAEDLCVSVFYPAVYTNNSLEPVSKPFM
jgi:hypothetical protein